MTSWLVPLGIGLALIAFGILFGLALARSDGARPS